MFQEPNYGVISFPDPSSTAADFAACLAAFPTGSERCLPVRYRILFEELRERPALPLYSGPPEVLEVLYPSALPSLAPTRLCQKVHSNGFHSLTGKI